MRIRIAVPEKHVNASILDAALEATTRANEAALKAGDAKPISPFIKAGRVRWKPEPFTDGEHFDLSRQVVERGWGDCDDLAPAYAAELRYTGRDPGARAVVRRSGPNLWHAVTLLSDGTVKDPSRSAGMQLSVTGPANSSAGRVLLSSRLFIMLFQIRRPDAECSEVARVVKISRRARPA